MIVVSSGFHKTHVTTAAREASDRGLLSLAITAAYPTERFARIAHRLGVSGKGRVARLMERGEEIPEAQLKSLFLPELLDEAARACTRSFPLGRLHPALSVASWRLYGRLAAGAMSAAEDARIFHFRAGFGHASIDRARELGMVVLCDHAIAHPALLDELVENRGAPPRMEGRHAPGASEASLANRFERAIWADIDRCDHVVANSDFVGETFLALGWPAERVDVVYLGVDDNFLRAVPAEPREVAGGRLRLLFAGRLERRKGADVLIEALRGLHDVDWELEVAGPVTPEIGAAHRAFLEDERVRLPGTLRRRELAKRMRSAPVFVFPSYAEGSARAVFEALACGCYVITTPNSGTIVEDGVHGALIPPGDSERLREAIVAADGDRARIAEIGNRNAALVAEQYRQVDYGDGLAAVYEKLVSR